VAELSAIVDYLDELLATRLVPDKYCSNGLQVEGRGPVERVGFCVDACQQTFELLSDCQLVVVHHGLFWPSFSSVTGPLYRSLRYLLERGMALYCSHLPLDYHRELGNNAQLLKLLGLAPEEAFAPVGWTARLAEPTSAQALAAQLETALGRVRLLEFGPDQVTRLAVSSGQASTGMIAQARQLGCDLLLTGEASHPTYHAAREAGLHVILGGHYATETWGVRALMPELERQFGVATRFVDVPTGF